MGNVSVCSASTSRNLQVMEEFHLGPNGGLVYCMEFLSKNFEWLSDKIKSMLEEDKYLLIDCPGQVHIITGILSSSFGDLQPYMLTLG